MADSMEVWNFVMCFIDNGDPIWPPLKLHEI